MDESPILRYFVYDHLPEKLQDVSKAFSILAHAVEETIPVGPEKSVALRKLLEAKDAAVRAALDADSLSEQEPAGRKDLDAYRP
jgi:hypothetical protein